MTRPFLSPRNDAVFKMLFGDAQDTSLLTEFLKSTLTLPAEDYEDVTIIDPHSRRDAPDDKQGILDVKVKTASGKRIDIEIVRREVAQVIVPPEKYPGRDLMFRHQ